MNDLPQDTLSPTSLEQLLLREDLWMGHSQRFTARPVLGTGHEQLNLGLLNRGWPLGSLVEVCQQDMHGEWQLFTPSLLQLSGLIVLVNPPAQPFCQAFIQAGLDLDRLIVVCAPEKSQFIACFIELSRANVDAVLAWQPHEAMTYTELRKCSLAASEGSGLSVIFRPSTAQKQSSPAALRLFSQQVPTGLAITVFKQKGHLQAQQPRPIQLALPDKWQPALAHHALNQHSAADTSSNKPQRLTSVTPFRGKS
jgi:protein ImuA